MKFLVVLTFLLAAASAGKLPRSVPHPLLPVLPLVELEGRIVGGKVAAIGQFPHQVGLRLTFGSQGAFCGGTLISNRYILTAAHCTDGADGVTVSLGAHNINDSDEKGQQQIFVGKSGITTHQEWSPSTLSNDISLIKLPTPIEFNDRIQPATLPKKNGDYSTYEGELAYASGWGKDTDGATSITPLLRFVEQPIIANSVCSKYYMGAVTDKMICISGKDGKSTCNGDSGGPLVIRDEKTNLLIGATSFGISLGCEKGWPAVFTRITSYLDWIEKESGVANN